MSKITNDVRLNPVWHRMLYSCNHMATVGVKGLKNCVLLFFRLSVYGNGQSFVVMTFGCHDTDDAVVISLTDVAAVTDVETCNLLIICLQVLNGLIVTDHESDILQAVL